MRYLLLTVAIISFSFTLQGQVSFGPTVALNISKQQTKGVPDEVKLKAQAGFQAGIFGNFKLGKKFGLHTELVYSAEGTTSALLWNDFSEDTYTVSQKFNYLRLPILVQYRITGELNIEAGPGLAYLLGGKTKWDDGDVEKFESGDYLPFDAGLSLGVGYDLSKFAPGLTAGLRYYHGFINIANEDSDEYSLKNRNFSLHVRYALPFGKK
ncbi:MAG: PorT family protein [Chitinophagaceae bacterium]|nr:PorT family protein [Chitinophagaceae bacterium]